MPTKDQLPKDRLPQVPAALADVSFIAGPSAAAAAALSISQWHELVRSGEAPQPAFRSHRCTRWRLTDVRDWLIQRGQPAADRPTTGPNKAGRRHA
jgi:hypothetical protein